MRVGRQPSTSVFSSLWLRVKQRMGRLEGDGVGGAFVLFVGLEFGWMMVGKVDGLISGSAPTSFARG